MANWFRIRRMCPPGKFLRKKPGIQSFGGFGTAGRILVRGMVVEQKGIVCVEETDKLTDNLRKMKRRFLSAPGRGVEVEATLGEIKKRVRTDDQGFFSVELDLKDLPQGPCLENGICDVKLELLHCAPGHECVALGRAHVPPDSARFGVISDIDDTIVYTFSPERLRMTYIVLTNNARNRLPFSGVREFYRALHDGPGGNEKNPFFYVSSSSWRLYDVMRDFMRINDMPPGPVLLRAMAFTRSSLFDPRRHDHKKLRFMEILSAYPDLPFLLIGDSGQRDAELYTELARRHPGRIPALFLRDILPNPRKRETILRLADRAAEAGSELHLVDTSLEAAQIAAKRGWINPARLPAIEKDWTLDEPDNPVLSMLSKTARGVARLTRPVRRRKKRARNDR